MALLNEILSQNPADPFARYGLAMEYSNAGDVERALDEFKKLLATNLTIGRLLMAAQTLTRAGQTDEARRCWSDGISSAKRTGNAHAESEMEECSLTWIVHSVLCAVLTIPHSTNAGNI